MDAIAAIILGLMIAFTCGNTLHSAVMTLRDGERATWRPLLVGVLGLAIGVILLIVGIAST